MRNNILIIDINNEYNQYDMITLDDLFEYPIGINRIILTTDDEFLYFVEIISHYENYIFIIDEFDIFSDNLDNIKEWRQLLILSRHKNIDFIFNSRRPYRIPKLINSQLDSITCFNIIEPRDLKYIENITGSKEYIEIIKNLKQYEYATYKF